MPKLIGTGLDSPDTASWKPTKEQSADDKVPASRNMIRQIEKLQRDNANPSR
jgi:hypothetical protein